MARHPLKMSFGAFLSVWPFGVGLEMAQHLCLLVLMSGHFVTRDIAVLLFVSSLS